MTPLKPMLAACAAVCAALLALLLGATATPAKPTLGADVPLRWTGNFDSGTFKQWARTSFVPGDVKIVHSVRRQGRYAARFVVRPGDRPFGGGERSEVAASQNQTAGYGGMSAFYGWSTYFPQDFNPIRDSWNIFAQWHSTGSWPCGPGPNVDFNARLLKGWRRPRYEIRVNGGEIGTNCQASASKVFRLGPIAQRKWNDFVLHVKWSAAHQIGYIEAWINGRRVVPPTHTSTLYRHRGAQLQFGLYRGPGEHTSKLFQDAMRRGPTYASVNPRHWTHPVPR
jgi:hypothetical protein